MTNRSTASAPRRRGGSFGWFSARERLWLGVAFSIVVVVTWEAVTSSGLIRPILFPSFTSVIRELWAGIAEGWLLPHLRATGVVWVLGYIVAVVVGIAIGLLAGYSRRISYIANPWLNAIYVTPDIALVPIFILWFGIGLSFKVWYVFLSGVFFVAVNTLVGVEATEGRFLAVARSFGASTPRTFKTVILPVSVPYIATGLRQAAGRSLVGVIAAEFVASNQGVGFMTSLAGQTFQTDRVLVGILVLAGAGIGVSELLRLFEKRYDHWRA